jgi:hypothetical protein
MKKVAIFDYLLFFTAGVIFLLAVNFFRGEKLIEFLLLLAFVSFYIIYGIYHHAIRNKLRAKIVIEYILIGFLALYFLKLLIYP